METVYHNFVLRDSQGAEYGTVTVDVHEEGDGWTGWLHFTKDVPLSGQVEYMIEHETLGKFKIKVIEPTEKTSRKTQFVGHGKPPKEDH
jgi:hypothetical protein